MNVIILKRAFIYIWEIGKMWVIASVALSLILGSLPVILIWLTKELVNNIAALITSSGHYKIALIILLMQFGVMVLDSVLRHLQVYMDQKMSIKLDHDLGLNIITKLNNVPYSLFDIPEFYDHIERIQSSAGNKFLSPINNIFGLLEALVSIFSLLTFLFSIHWGLGLVSILALIPVLLIKSYYGNKQFWLNYYMAPVAREAGYIRRLLTERQYAKEIKVFNLSPHLISRWSDKFLINANKSLLLLKKSKKAEIGLDGLSAFFYAVSAGILIWLTQKSAVKIGEFVAIGQAVQSTQSAISQISMSLAGIYEDSLYIKDYYSFMDFEISEMKNNDGHLMFPEKLTDGIKFNNVSFKYPGSEVNALSNISLSVQPNEKIAIVGHNGSGKTTLVKCLLGLYPVTEGSIHFDNINSQLINPESLNQNITTIFQDFIKYSFTVKENIGFSDVKELENSIKIIEAAKRGSIHDDILKLSNQYETNLGKFLKDGVDLSGGQWQRMALARALFKDSKIIILDEPTAALDPLAEIELLNHFKTLSEGKTSFFISHRMAVGKMVDRIMVMKNGELVEMGTHKDLIRKNGEYAKLYNIQAQMINNQEEIGV
ncbi:ABC transporter ATP-binding protein [Paenisporosarcina indica]|uniref:ABC transporter ATP-binding protein n=1 Tax=Paenisporosarcina indica TaxID=650093 RepID=UPI0009501225|nr:ABC transporter ATP-binding protein [Paenisporosarcina indica]